MRSSSALYRLHKTKVIFLMMDDADFPLPRVLELLKPYLRPPEEVLRIRQVLAVYFSAVLQATERNNAKVEPLRLVATSDKSRHGNEIPADLIGAWKEYLVALNENAESRREFAALTATSSERGSIFDSPSVRTSGPPDSLQLYTEVLGLRKSLEQLQILRRQLENLATSAEAVDVENLASDLTAATLSGGQEASTFQSDLSETDIDELVVDLQKSLLRTNRLNAQEEMAVAELKASTASQSKNYSLREFQRAKNKALLKTKDELVSWIDTELSKSSGDGHEAVLPLLNSPASDREELLQDVKARYESYVRTRREVLSLVSQLDRAEAMDTVETTPTAVEQATTTDKKFGVHDLLPHISQKIMPLRDSQRFILQQKSHMASTLAKQQRLDLQTLERLSEESQLFHNYPSMVERRAQGFGTPASRPGELLHSVMPDLDHTIGEICLSKTRSWAFAAGEATISTNATVKDFVEAGNKDIGKAEAMLAEIRRLSSREVDAQLRGGHSKNPDSTRSVDKDANNDLQSIWYELQGNVGLE